MTAALFVFIAAAAQTTRGAPPRTAPSRTPDHSTGASALGTHVAEPVETEADEPAAEPTEKYDEMPVNASLKRTSVGGILSAGDFAAGQQQTFDDYYLQYFLARWTQPENLGKLHDFRKELRNHLSKKIVGGGTAVHDHLNKLVLDFMNKLIAGHYNPAVQVNAMLAIGELNSVETTTPPTPLPEALDVMIDAVKDTKISDAVRTEALAGIQRHIAAGITDEETRRTVTATLLKVAAAEATTAGNPGREWILTQAIATLGRLGAGATTMPS